ncbi:MAG: pyridoxal 5'-phosphate synthase lyase subunit PdxS, partial [Thermoplasmata archaeon]
DKRKFEVPFVCGARNLGEAVRRIFEGAAMIRTKGEAGTGNVIEAVRHQRLINQAIDDLKKLDDAALNRLADTYAISYCNLLGDVRSRGKDAEKIDGGEHVYEGGSLSDVCEGLVDVVIEIKELSRLPVVNFAAGGLATPSDVAMMMQLGCDGVFVGSGIFKSENPKERGIAIVEATTNFDDPSVIAEVSKGLGDAMKGLEISEIPEDQRLQERGW